MLPWAAAGLPGAFRHSSWAADPWAPLSFAGRLGRSVDLPAAAPVDLPMPPPQVPGALLAGLPEGVAGCPSSSFPLPGPFGRANSRWSLRPCFPSNRVLGPLFLPLCCSPLRCSQRQLSRGMSAEKGLGFLV
eukprot:4561764-Heterocapsa_arctica.AAC.1